MFQNCFVIVVKRTRLGSLFAQTKTRLGLLECVQHVKLANEYSPTPARLITNPLQFMSSLFELHDNLQTLSKLGRYRSSSRHVNFDGGRYKSVISISILSDGPKLNYNQVRT